MSACRGRRRRGRRAHFDAQRLAEKTLELCRVTRGCPQLQFCIAGGTELKQAVVPAIVQLEARNRLRVAAIEAFRETEHGRQRANRPAALLLEVAVVVVAALGRCLPMIPRDERNDIHFFGIEAPEVAVLNQVVGVLVVALIADMDADVVEDGGVFEPLALVVGEAVNHPRLIEEHRRELGDLLCVLGPVIAAFGELEHAATADVRIAIGLCDFLPMA
jgi:hypothetical protein